MNPPLMWTFVNKLREPLYFHVVYGWPLEREFLEGHTKGLKALPPVTLKMPSTVYPRQVVNSIVIRATLAHFLLRKQIFE